MQVLSHIGAFLSARVEQHFTKTPEADFLFNFVTRLYLNILIPKTAHN